MARSWGGSRLVRGGWIYANPSFRFAPTRSEPFFFGASFEPRGKDRWLPLKSPRDVNVPPFVFNATGNYCKWLSTKKGRLIFLGVDNSCRRLLTQRFQNYPMRICMLETVFTADHTPAKCLIKIQTSGSMEITQKEVRPIEERRNARKITSYGIAISSSES